MAKMEYANPNEYKKTVATLINTGVSAEHRLRRLRDTTAKIFETDEKGNIKLERRGDTATPKFNLLYILFNIKKVAALLAALVQFAIDILSGELWLPNPYFEGVDPMTIKDDEEPDTTLEELPKDLHPVIENIQKKGEEDNAETESANRGKKSRSTTTKKPAAKKPTKKNTNK